MTPAQWIADLDAALRESGQDVTLYLLVNGERAPGVGTTLRAFVRGYKPHEVIGGITQKDRSFIVSPTSVAAIPEGSELVVDGKSYRAEQVEAVKVGGTLVRFNVTGRG